MVDVATLTSVLTAAGFGTIAGSVIARSKDRREARAAALKTVHHVESQRWGRGEWDDFNFAVREASAASLLAQVPRSITRGYLSFACFARLESENLRNLPVSTGFSGAIDVEVARLVGTALNILVGSLWHPWVGFTVGRLRMWMLRRRAEKLSSTKRMTLKLAIRNVP